MVYVIHVRVGVDQFYKVLDNLDDVIVGERALAHRYLHIQFAVDTVASHLAKVIALVGEEQVLYHFAGCRFVSRLRIAQLTVYIEYRLFLRVGRVFLQSIEYNGVLGFACFLLMEQNRLGVGFQNALHQFGCKFRLTLNDDLVTFNGHHLTGILVHEILRPRVEDIACQRSANAVFKILAGAFHLLRQSEAVKDILVRLITYGTQQGGHGQFLLAVDVGIHDIVDVGGEFYPRPAERNDTRGIEFSAVGVHRSAEEHTGRAVQLTHNHTLRPVDDKRPFGSHIRYGPQENILNDGVKILVVRVSAVEFEFRFQRHRIGQTAFDTLVYAVVRMVNVIIQKLKDEIVARVRYREILAEHSEQAFLASLFWCGVNLKELTERFNLDIQKVRIRELLLHRREIDSLCSVIGCHLILYYLN